MAGIEAYGYHLPRYSIRGREYVNAVGHFAARGVEEKIIPGWDEDEVTMALEALQRALEMAPAGGEPRLLIAASSSARHPVAQTLAQALGLGSTEAVDIQGNSHAAVEALLVGLETAGSGEGRVLVVSSDALRGAPDDPFEHGLGAGAAAFVLGPGGGAEVRARATETTEDLVGPREDAQGFLRAGASPDAGVAAMGRLARAAAGDAANEVAGVACHEWDGRTAREALSSVLPKELTEAGAVRFAGYTGSSSPMLNLVVALGDARVGQTILMVGHGAGRTTGVLWRVTAKVPGVGIVTGEPKPNRRYLTYPEYLRLRGSLANPTVNRQTALGAYVPLATYQAAVGQRYRLIGQVCTKCHAKVFPPKASCPSCGGEALQPHALNPRGRLHSFTIIARGAAPTEFLEQQEAQGEYAIGLVQLEDGPRITAQITDVEPGALEVEMPVGLVLRKLYRQEGIVRYGMKFRPLSRDV